MKKVLVINHSQSGQLDEILNNFLIPFQTFDIDRVKIEPEKPFPFPWSSAVFFDAMPETVLEEEIALQPFKLKHRQYDLIILGHQPWFLSPSLPATSLLKDPSFCAVLKDTPIATVIGARNMWLNAQKSVVREIESAGGQLIANVPFIDKVQNHISALTILHWMLTGKKTKKWGLLPKPGVSDRDIEEAQNFGQPVAEALSNGDYSGLQKEILAHGGIYIAPSILMIESRAKKLFLIWANLIKKKSVNASKRSFWVGAFKWYLVTALFLISPPLLLINWFINLFRRKAVKKNQEHFLYLGIKRA